MPKILQDIKPLIIGTGLAGTRHLEAQLQQGVKTAVYNQNPKSTEKFNKNPNIIVFDDLKEGLNWSNLVHVCTPDNKHTEYVSLALKRGKAIICEKPIATKLKEAIKLRDLTHKLNGILIIGHNYRLTPSFMETKRLISEGTMGTITAIETNYLDDMDNYRFGSKWRNTQDFLYVGGSHAVDLILWMMDERVISVQAAVGTKIKTEYESPERYQIILKFASGKLGHISLDSSSAQQFDGSAVIIWGDQGKISSHNQIDEMTVYNKSTKRSLLKNLPNRNTLTTAEEIKIIDNYLLGKISSFYPLPGVDEAVEVIKVLDAIEKAVYSGKSERL